MSQTSFGITICDLLERQFQLAERGTDIATEVRAGTASFLTLSYLLLVNPKIMSEAGVDHDDAVFATALSATVSCFIIGFFGNLPFGCAPGLGLSAYLTFGLVQAEMCTLPQALSACWWSGIFVLAISLSGGTAVLMRTVPQAIKLAIVVGMGLLIAMIGLVTVGIIVANPKTLVELGPVWSDSELQLCLIGILLVASLLHHDTKGAILIGIIVLTVVDWIFKDSWPTQIFQLPLYNSNHYFDPSVLWDLSIGNVIYPAIGCFVLICIFDISGVIFGLATLGGIMKEDGEIPGSTWAFVASGVGTILAALTGSTPIIVCVETASGVREGGRTGLTAVVIGCYFAASLFLAPLFSSVPDVATAPVLVMVGVMMMGEAAKIDWDKMSDALPAFLTIILMPLTYSITNGMIFGLLAAFGFYFTTGQFMKDANELHSSCKQHGDTEENEEGANLVEAEAKSGSYGTV
ncbi:unnamed protein product [Cylindrotheca closterium]|uniref:Uncharacterized protein n=1 Tax=Cylindrotheca closterium TaxID=2856 RepID=A0AAD2GBU4_9STRA|nr:unnamed protein product [Cylindrotheca closterium]